MTLKNSFSKIVKSPKGSYGYDNQRENIDPHVKTKVVSAKSFIVNDIKVLDLTASKFVKTDSNKFLVSTDITPSDLVPTIETADVQTVNTGTLTSGTITDVQTWADGNEVHITEVTGVPGFDVEYRVDNITDFAGIIIAFHYEGSNSHAATLQIYDDTNTTWKTLYSQTGTALNHNLRYVPFPDPNNISDYINGSNQVKLRFYHPQSGNASHDLYIDFVALIC
jgi:hypothetical protein|tara:strand:+ start:4924 stop:5592 length:669 start_codon:yes stop_codon:yes gene_type:complete